MEPITALLVCSSCGRDVQLPDGEHRVERVTIDRVICGTVDRLQVTCNVIEPAPWWKRWTTDVLGVSVDKDDG